MPFTAHMAVALGISLLLVILLLWVKCPLAGSARRLALRLGLGAAAAAVTVCWYAFGALNYSFMVAHGFYETSRYDDLYYANSFYTAFITLAGDQLIGSPPDGYSDELVAEIDGELSQRGESGTRTPDVIEILLESFDDLDTYHKVAEFENLTENWDALQAESVSGEMISRGYGSGTGDIEFEVLTGFDSGDELIQSVAFSETTPNLPTMTNYLKTKGYRLYAVHAYTSALYHRETGYANLGFDETYFIDSFDADAEKIGEYVSDKASVEKIISLYEEKTAEDDSPVYLHGVTMQNHGPHDTEKGIAESDLVSVQCGGLDEAQNAQLSSLCTRLKLTDEAVAELIDYFRTVDRDVVIVLYGDHQPILTDEAGYDFLSYTDYFSTEDADVNLHKVPYLVWSNTGTGSAETDADGNATFGTISPNLLMPEVLKTQDIVSPAYFGWLLDESAGSSVKARSGSYAVRADGTAAELADEDLDALLRRHVLQYNVMKKHGVLWGDMYGE